jgi:gliding motility-associated-like protein
MLRRKNYLITVFLISINCLFAFKAQAILSPQLRCLSVALNGSGDVTLTWQPVTDVLMEFASYDIYSATNLAGPYTLTGTVNTITTDNFLHVASPANANIVYYYIQTRTISGPSIPAIDTLATMFLNVTNLGGGIAQLTWNAPHTPLLATTSPMFYSIYKEYPAGNWSFLSTTTNQTYLDTITVCTSQINYRVEISDNYPCTSVSNINGGIFTDTQQPKEPLLDSVTVNYLAGTTTLGWEQSTSTDVQGYNIYISYDNISYSLIGSVAGIANTTFTYGASNANNVVEYYKIAAFDGACPANQSVLSLANHYQRSIHTTVVLDTCLSINTVRWNRYINIPTGLAGYKVLASLNGGPYTQLSVTPDTFFIHSGLVTGTQYCYIITAFNNARTITATSNRACVNVTLPVSPSFSYLKTATVTSSTSVNISAEVDIAADVSSYNVYRTTNPAAAYSKIGSIPFSGTSPIFFTDNSASTSTTSYYYKIVPVNNCLLETTPETNIGRTILLSGIADEALNNTLTWNDYSTWIGNVSSYNIYRSDDGGLTFSIIANIPFGGGNTYTDNVFNSTGTGNYFYYVQALEGGGNSYGSDSSNSNIVEVKENPILFIPNAFNPGGINPLFQPKGSFIKKDDYRFMIFDRWGKKIFETTDPQEGWDGTYGGSLLPEGMYVYSLKFQSRPGEIVKKEGGVFLLR